MVSCEFPPEIEHRRQYLMRLRESRKPASFVALAGSKVVGFGVSEISEDKETAFLHRVQVHADYQKRDIALRLVVVRVKSLFEDTGVERVFVNGVSAGQKGEDNYVILGFSGPGVLQIRKNRYLQLRHLYS